MGHITNGQHGHTQQSSVQCSCRVPRFQLPQMPFGYLPLWVSCWIDQPTFPLVFGGSMVGSDRLNVPAIDTQPRRYRLLGWGAPLSQYKDVQCGSLQWWRKICWFRAQSTTMTEICTVPLCAMHFKRTTFLAQNLALIRPHHGCGKVSFG